MWDCDDESHCSYCGKYCCASCDDPDSCPSCWPFRGSHNDDMDSGYEEGSGQIVDGCMETGCQCPCHENLIKVQNYKFDDESKRWVKEDSEKDGENEFQREGVFPFLDLAGEIRAKTYGYTMLAEGKRRYTGFVKGKIHTNILLSCRQINSEARHVPLTVNKLSFKSSLYALNFFGSCLAPSQHNLVTSMHLDVDGIPELHHASFRMLMKQLSAHRITHLEVTFMGWLDKPYFADRDCFIVAFGRLKDLKSFDLILGSQDITEEDKNDFQESVREILVKGYVKALPAPKLKVRKMKGDGKVTTSEESSQVVPSERNASPGSSAIALKSNAEKTQIACTATTRASGNTTIQISPQSMRENLLEQYVSLDVYARTFDVNATAVKIRLDQARVAAEALDQKLFEETAASVLKTLEEEQNALAEQLVKIKGARAQLPAFLETS